MSRQLKLKKNGLLLGKTFIRDGRAPIPLKEITSIVMSSNKARNTRPEIRLRKVFWHSGLRGYRLHAKNVPGRPDIAFISKKIAVFVNGCFWHRCPHCNLPLPKTNQDFWKNKFECNLERDNRKIKELKKLGWKTIVIWECEIKTNVTTIVEKLKNKL
jgi:DNA mismatch endonuclease (patch repair protein)